MHNLGAGVVTARCELAAEFPDDIRRLDAKLRDTSKKLSAAVRASGTSLTGIFGVGPVIAGTVIGDVRQGFRFGSRDHFAAGNSTAPVEVPSGGRKVSGCRCRATAGSTTPSAWQRCTADSSPDLGRATGQW